MSMTKIATITVGAGGATSLDFTAIPGNMTDLLVVFSLRVTDAATAGQFYLSLNGITADSSYTRKLLFGDGASAVSYGGAQRSDLAAAGANATASTFSSGSIYIPNYASANTKVYSIDAVTENNATEARQTLLAGSWNSTSAITEVGIKNGGTAVQYSSATLYGITKGSLAGVTVS
jgi:hypothetical protein